MLATRWQPFRVWSEMSRLQDEMNRIFGRYSDGPRQYTGTHPAVNLWENDDRLFVEAELPGLELNDLEIFVNGGRQLTLKGERKRPEIEGSKWHRHECGYGQFARVFELPCDVDSGKVEASYKHGVLRIELSKQEAAKPRKIEVKTA